MPRIIFITGTDTGVGKTVVTALLAHCARLAGREVAALKPFSTGDRSDAEILGAVCGLSPDAINPWHFPDPLSPWTAARQHGVRVSLEQALQFIRGHSRDLVLVEGAGGVLSPLGEGFNSADLIRELGCQAVLVAANKLGVLNHALLSLRALPPGLVKIALVAPAAGADPSSAFNLSDLQELAAPVSVIPFPRLAGLSPDGDSIARNSSLAAQAVRALLE